METGPRLLSTDAVLKEPGHFIKAFKKAQGYFIKALGHFRKALGYFTKSTGTFVLLEKKITRIFFRIKNDPVLLFTAVRAKVPNH